MGTVEENSSYIYIYIRRSCFFNNSCGAMLRCVNVNHCPQMLEKTTPGFLFSFFFNPSIGSGPMILRERGLFLLVV